MRFIWRNKQRILQHLVFTPNGSEWQDVPLVCEHEWIGTVDGPLWECQQCGKITNKETVLNG